MVFNDGDSDDDGVEDDVGSDDDNGCYDVTNNINPFPHEKAYSPECIENILIFL